MDLGNRLLMWWDRVRGYEQPTAKPADSSQRPPQRQPRPTGARALNQVNEGGAGGPLKLSVEGAPTAPRHDEAPSGEPSDKLKPREAGFDPYSSMGKYGKPRGWDDVPRK